MTLYHGSPHAGLKEPKPFASNALDGESAVFATPDKGMALSFMAPWSDKDFDLGSVNGGPLTLQENRPGAFQDVFGGRSGTLYRMPDVGFQGDPRLMPQERVSRNAVAPLDSEFHPDLLKSLQGSDLVMKHASLDRWFGKEEKPESRQYGFDDFTEDVFAGTAGVTGGGLAANAAAKNLSGHSPMELLGSEARQKLLKTFNEIPANATNAEVSRTLFDKGLLRGTGKWAPLLLAGGTTAAGIIGGTLAAGEMRQAVQSQKERGERFRKQGSLDRWFKEKWTAQDGSDCGAYRGKGRVKCRPKKKVNSKTPETWGQMSKGEKRKAVKNKQKAHRAGKQFSSHKTDKSWGDKDKGKNKYKATVSRQGGKRQEKKSMLYEIGYLAGIKQANLDLQLGGYKEASTRSEIFGNIMGSIGDGMRRMSIDEVAREIGGTNMAVGGVMGALGAMEGAGVEDLSPGKALLLAAAGGLGGAGLGKAVTRPMATGLVDAAGFLARKGVSPTLANIAVGLPAGMAVPMGMYGAGLGAGSAYDSLTK